MGGKHAKAASVGALLVAIGLLPSAPATGNMVSLGTTESCLPDCPADGMQGRLGDATALFRYSVSNHDTWDMAIATSGSAPQDSMVTTADLGGFADLNNHMWNFTIDYAAGSGYTFSMSDGAGNLPDQTLLWTSFYGGASPTDSFTVIDLSLTAGDLTNSNSGYVAIQNLAFAAPAGFASSGTLLPSGLLSGGSEDVSAHKYIVSDTDLSLYSWSLTGQVIAGCNGTCGDGSGSVLLDVRMSNVVPIPASLPILSAAFGLFGFAGWRHRQLT